MSNVRESKKKKGSPADNTEKMSWKQKKILADQEEEEISKDVQELITWTSLIESMNDEQLKEYLANRPEHMHSVKLLKATPNKRVQRNGKSKCSSSNGLMEAIWKFHKEDDEDTSRILPVGEISLGTIKE